MNIELHSGFNSRGHSFKNRLKEAERPHESRLRRHPGWLAPLLISLFSLLVLMLPSRVNYAEESTGDVERSVNRALEFLVRQQRRSGEWEVPGGQFKIPMTALSGVALLSEGSTTTRGKYARNIRQACGYVLSMAQPNGLIGDPSDSHYMYGHGFSILFLSEIFGEEEDESRRKEIKNVLERAVRFSIEAQTTRGGWGYMSAFDGHDFDEGSTCITQVQGLRACRNAGIFVPREVIERAKAYIYACMAPDGGVNYSIKGGGTRPPITAAAIAAMYNAGEYGDAPEIRKMRNFCRINIWSEGMPISMNGFGHWHYLHYYFAQVMYRDVEVWPKYSRELNKILLATQANDGSWTESQFGSVYATAVTATILQLDRGALSIYER